MRTQYPTYQITSDISRDLYIAKHFFSSQNQSIFIRPNSSVHGIPNTPVYFWFIATFYLFTQSYYGVLFVHSILQSLVVLIAYLTIRTFAEHYIAIICTIFFVFSPILISNANIVQQFTLQFLFIALSIFFVCHAIKNKNYSNRTIILSIVSFSCALFLHNSAIPLFIGFSVVWLYIAKKHEKNAVGIMIFILAILAIFLLLAYQGEWSLMAEYIQDGLSLTKTSNIRYELLSRLGHGFYALKNDSFFFPYGLVLLSIAFLSWLKVKTTAVSMLYLHIFFILICSSIVSFLSPQMSWYTNYFITPYYLPITYAVIYMFTFIPKRIFLLVSIVFITKLLLFQTNAISINYHYDPFVLLKQAGVSTTLALEGNRPSNVLISFPDVPGLPHLSSWNMPALLLFTEYKAKLVDASIFENNFLLESGESDLLVCIDIPDDNYFNVKRCLNDFSEITGGEAKLSNHFDLNEKNYYFFQTKTKL